MKLHFDQLEGRKEKLFVSTLQYPVRQHLGELMCIWIRCLNKSGNSELTTVFLCTLTLSA